MATLKTFTFPEAIQDNFVLKSYTHYLEKQRILIKQKPYSSYVSLPYKYIIIIAITSTLYKHSSHTKQDDPPSRLNHLQTFHTY